MGVEVDNVPALPRRGTSHNFEPNLHVYLHSESDMQFFADLMIKLGTLSNAEFSGNASGLVHSFM